MARERPDATAHRSRAKRREHEQEPEQRLPAWSEDAELRRSVNAAVQDDDADDEED